MMLRIVVFDKEFYKELGESVFVDEFQRKWRINSVQKAAETLVRQHIITHDKGVFEIYDRFFALWLATM